MPNEGHVSKSTSDASESEIERLSLIRYQLRSVDEMMQMPQPINTLAINAMQDLVESTLATVGEHVRAGVKNDRAFDKLFDAVVEKLGSPDSLAGMRAATMALNTARVGFKHHGNQVRDETLRRHRDTAVNLAYELIAAGFGIDLDTVSLLVFIKNESVRRYIEKADRIARGEDRLTHALSYLRVAFDLTVDDYANSKSVDGWKSILDIAPWPAFHVSRTGYRDLDDTHEKLHEWIKALDDRLRLLSMGIDLSRYAYFDAVAPIATYAVDHGRGPWMNVRFSDVTKEQYRSAYLFVVDTAIRLSVNDFVLGDVHHVPRSAESYDPEYYSEEYLARQEESERRMAALRERESEDDSIDSAEPGSAAE